MKLSAESSRTPAGPGKNIIRTWVVVFLFYSSMSLALTSADDIQSLITTGKLQEALRDTNEHLAEDEGNISYRFLKGLILTKMNKLDQAREIFTKLTQEHPDLPEPYNNLAVIYAAQGDFDNARAALQQAINTHPSYATAHENMGDIYAKMAVIAYSEALELDNENKTAREKLSLISELFSAKAKEQLDIANARQIEAEKAMAKLGNLEQQLTDATNQAKNEQQKADELKTELITLKNETTRAVNQAQQKQAQAEQHARQAQFELEQANAELDKLKKARVETADQARRQQAEAEQQAKLALAKVEQARSELDKLQQQQAEIIKQAMRHQEESEQQAREAQLKVEQARAELAKLEQERVESIEKSKLEKPGPVMPVKETQSDKRDQIVQAVLNWARYWSAQDLDKYLSSYSDNFTPANGLSHSQWANQRKRRIKKPKFIDVDITDIKISYFDDEHTRASFIQTYKSDTYSDKTRKTLLMKNQEGSWKIIEENSD